jgi:hypothetical protein
MDGKVPYHPLYLANTTGMSQLKLEKNSWAGHVTDAEGERFMYGFDWKA